jgi:hypothetical protein
MDPDLGRYPVVWAAAGTDTAVFPVPPATLRLLANATVSPIAEERRRADVIAEAGGSNGRGDARSPSTSIPRSLGAIAPSGPVFESVAQRGPALELGERATIDGGGHHDGAGSAGRP